MKNYINMKIKENNKKWRNTKTRSPNRKSIKIKTKAHVVVVTVHSYHHTFLLKEPSRNTKQLSNSQQLITIMKMVDKRKQNTFKKLLLTLALTRKLLRKRIPSQRLKKINSKSQLNMNIRRTVLIAVKKI